LEDARNETGVHKKPVREATEDGSEAPPAYSEK